MAKQQDQQFTIRFAGDSGDGIQLIGQQLTFNCIASGWQVQVMPDFPAEIRAPQGTIAGVSGYQLTTHPNQTLHALGDQADVLVAFNVAAIEQAKSCVKPNGLILYNLDNCQKKDFAKIGDKEGTISDLLPNTVLSQGVQISSLTLAALEDIELSHSDKKKAKNFFALGLIHWFLQIPLSASEAFIEQKFAKNNTVAQANLAALRAGHYHAETLELPHWVRFDIEPASDTDQKLISGYKAISLAMAWLTVKTQLPMLVAGYPITPASNILHEAALLSQFGISLFQAEDEIAAACAALGASFAGSLALTCTSGPGLDLKSETLGLAVMSELPLVVIDVQRAGPSTGLPTKTEQSDLMMAAFGRHGEAPLPVMAASRPSDVFETVIEAFKIAIQHMTPVIVLLDAQIVNGAERCSLPDLAAIEFPPVAFADGTQQPFDRDNHGKRPWIKPGTVDGMHRLGGLEKGDQQGSVSYDPAHHQAMVEMRQNKIRNIRHNSPWKRFGVEEGALLVISWGSTFGVVREAVDACNQDGYKIGLLHLHQVYPLPTEMAEILQSYRQVYVVEMNQGQLQQLIRQTFLVDAKLIGQTSGQPFQVAQLQQKFREAL